MILTNLSCFISCKEIDSLPKSNPATKTKGSKIKREITTILVLDFSLKMDIHLLSLFINFSVCKRFSKIYFVKNSFINKIASLILGPALEVISALIL